MASSLFRPRHFSIGLPQCGREVFDRVVGLGQKFSVGHEGVHLARMALDGNVTPSFSSRAA